MSFRKNDETSRLPRPTKTYIKFKGGRSGEKPLEGKFVVYDKEAGEDKEININGSVVLDKNLFSVTGYENDSKCYCWSNEVRSIDDEIVVRRFDDKKTIFAKGPYTEIKDTIKGKQGVPKYTRCIYLVLKDGTLAHLSLTGASIAPWIAEIENNSHNLDKKYIVTGDPVEGINGIVKFWTPTFGFGDDISDEDVERAIKLNDELQVYLKQYLKQDHSKKPEYDREAQNVSSWAFVEDDNGKELGSYSAEELDDLRQSLEDDGQVDSSMYGFVCQGLLVLQKETKEKEKKIDVPEKKADNPFKKSSAKDIFKSKKKVDDSWKAVKMPDGKVTVGEMSVEDVKSAKDFLDDPENIDTKQEFKHIYEALNLALNDEDIPF